jgi:hypothetical protein
MTRSACATACSLLFLLAISGTGRAEQACSGVVITDVIQSAAGELAPVGERCYERAPGVPYYYDAPGKSPSGRIEVERPGASSVTHFDAGTFQALGAQPINELTNPFPPGQGADRRPE